jgi:hypothetical protein
MRIECENMEAEVSRSLESLMHNIEEANQNSNISEYEYCAEELTGYALVKRELRKEMICIFIVFV